MKKSSAELRLNGHNFFENIMIPLIIYLFSGIPVNERPQDVKAAPFQRLRQTRRLRFPQGRSLDSRIASSISFREIFLRSPGTSNGDLRTGVFGKMENMSPLRRLMTTSLLFDSSRMSDNFSRACE
jgi:hypothetical protein